ncbi:unnamed protein product [Allacma fusca]|uniref:Large ribosomal subunit protein mL45 n=1 Tax=Allacma fusca TaxID=39272 RepID=A0A8J2JVB4_9HEXA|nr:unnamed protein product [Allacma fusca]
MLKLNQLRILTKLVPPPMIFVPIATKTKANKHWNPKWKKFRKLKVVKIKLPDFYDESLDLKNLTPDEIRSKMKEQGLQPPKIYQERTFDISSTSDAFEPYVPPEGDGKMSLISVGGVKQVGTLIGKKSRSYLTVRKIRTYDEDFDVSLFAPEAQDIYVNLHKAMTDVPLDRHKIRTLVTEKAYPDVVHNLRYKILKWDFLESIEPPRVVHGRHTDLISKDNIFAQLTVRFHTKQVLAVYDRFGRLIHGSPITAKDVLEYVVFEKHLSNLYGAWRIHHKIIPEWLTVAPQDHRTLRFDKEAESTPTDTKSLPSPPADSQEPSLSTPLASGTSQPQLSTA